MGELERRQRQRDEEAMENRRKQKEWNMKRKKEIDDDEEDRRLKYEKEAWKNRQKTKPKTKREIELLNGIPKHLPDTIMVPLEEKDKDGKEQAITLEDFQERSFGSDLAREVLGSGSDFPSEDVSLSAQEESLFTQIGF